MNKFLIIFIITIIFATLSMAKRPSEKTIKKWVNQNNFSIENIQNIYLLDNERAYLAELIFTGKDILIKKGLILVRPELDEARFIPSFPKDYLVIDLDHDGVSEIIFSQEQSFDTYTSNKRSLVQLHDYKRFELYSIEYKEEKNCKLCLVEDIQWGFEDLNKDKTKDLKQDYVLHVKSSQNSLVFKESIQEIEFNPKGLKHPLRNSNLLLKSMDISKDVIDREPVMAGQDFYLQDEKIYCLLNFENVKRQETITYHWIHEGLGKVLTIKQKIHPAARYRTWLYKDLNNDEKYLGDWIVIISDKYKNILGSKEFTITKNPAPDLNVSKEDINITILDTNTTLLLANTTTKESNVTH